jgi:hypothetical protein
MLDLDIERAHQLGDEGASKAAAHADRVHEGWSAIANAALARYGAVLGEFMTEDIRDAAVEVPDPPDARAWGAVIKVARKLGRIEFVRYASQKSANCHGSPKAVWRWVGA